MAQRINLDKLHNDLKPRLNQYATIIFPEAKKQTKGYRMGDISGAKGDSLWIGEDGFHDHATGEKGSLIKLAALHWGITIPAAARKLAELLGIIIEGDVAYEERRPVNRVLGPLTALHKETLKKRGLSEAIAHELGLQSSSDGNIAFPHYDVSGKMVGIKYHGPSGWHSEVGSAHVLWPLSYIANTFVDTDTIFITEGHWDAMAALQAGFPAVSIPNGASNAQWIEACFNFIHSFPRIVLCYDNDSAGIIGLKTVVQRLSKGVQVIQYPADCKDLNDVLIKHGEEALKAILANPKNFEPENVISAVSLMEQAKEIEEFAFEHDTPFGQEIPFRYRPHESTVITAYTGHGKSNYIRQSILHISSKYDAPSFIASFEDTPIANTRGMIRHMGPGLSDSDRHAILKNISFYDTTQLTKSKKQSKVEPEALIDLFIYQYQRYGFLHFVVDNLMTLKIDRQDNSAQSEASELFRQFTLSYPVHLHMVAHPRKPPPNNTKLTPPDPHEIRGASEIADMSFNVLGLVRNIPKEREIAKMRINHADEERILQYHRTNPDAIFHVNKQRTTGELPTIWAWFDHATKTFRTTP